MRVACPCIMVVHACRGPYQRGRPWVTPFSLAISISPQSIQDLRVGLGGFPANRRPVPTPLPATSPLSLVYTIGPQGSVSRPVRGSGPLSVLLLDLAGGGVAISCHRGVLGHARAILLAIPPERQLGEVREAGVLPQLLSRELSELVVATP